MSTGCKHCDAAIPINWEFQRGCAYHMIRGDKITRNWELCTRRIKPVQPMISGIYKNGVQIA